MTRMVTCLSAALLGFALIWASVLGIIDMAEAGCPELAADFKAANPDAP